MKNPKKKRNSVIRFLKIGLILLVIAASALATALYHYKAILENVASRALGAEVKIGRINLELKSGKLLISDFKLYNPEGFDTNKLLIEVPRISATFDARKAFFNNKLNLNTLDIYVKTLAVVKDNKGRFNIEHLAIFKEQFQEIPLQLGQLVLSADNVVFQDSSGGHLHTEYFDVGIKNQVYKGLPSFEDITATVFSEIIKRTTIRGARMLSNAVIMGAVGGWSLLIVGETLNSAYGKNGYEVVFNAGYDDAYKACLSVAGELSRNFHQRPQEGIIEGEIDDANVVIRVAKKEADKTLICVSARKYFLQQLNIAGGILYEITEKLRSKANLEQHESRL